MKKSYETPSVEVVKFQYRDQVVAASGGYDEHTCSVTHSLNYDGCKEETIDHKTSTF